MRLGTDPEFFLVKDGKLQAVCGMIGHDKWNPYQIPDLPEGFTEQEDNVAVEFGVPPASSAQEFINHINTVQQSFLARHQHLQFSGLSAALFPAKELKKPGALIFGCEPDYNAWTKEPNPRPASVNARLRSAGGHIHVETKEDPLEVVKAMDFFLGIPSTLMDVGGATRRQLYGKHGAHRVKPYGVEYRTLSNFWLFKPSYIHWVWNQTSRAVKEVAKGTSFDGFHEEIIECVDKNNTKLAAQMCDQYGLELA